MTDPVRLAVNEAPKWLVSILTHCLVLGILACFFVDQRQEPKRVQVVTDLLEDEREPVDFLNMIEMLDSSINLQTNVSLTPQASAESFPDAAQLQTQRSMASAAEATAAVFDKSLNRPLARTNTKMALGDNVEGLAGVTVSAAGGDAGAVDQITLEILRQLNKSKVLVAWIMDSSGSLNMRREAVLQRFDRVYDELGVVAQDKEKALLTGIVAFGQKTVFMTEKPTSDTGELKRAVRSIRPDPSGQENIFSAVRETCLRWRNYQTHGRRKLMLVVLTDEIGDDPSLLDDTCKLVKRYNAPVYVLGPMAPFGRKEVSVRWTDEPTGEVFMVPVERGPETVQPEHLSLPYWYNGPQYNLFASGFGPYALTRLAQESGGIYFVFDDNNIPGPKFNIYDLLAYVPDYISYSEYGQMMQKHPLRAAIVKAAQESEGTRGQPPMQFETENFKESLTRAQRVVATTLVFVERALANLRQAEKARAEESSLRWQAHYDLMMGRLLATKVRCNEYNWALAQMKLNPKPVTEKDKNAWALAGDATIAFGQQEAKAGRKQDRDTELAKKDAEEATAFLKRVLEEHPNTPWSVMAQRELESPLGFKWVQTYIPPPPERARTERDRAAAERAQRRAEAAKRVPKL